MSTVKRRHRAVCFEFNPPGESRRAGANIIGARSRSQHLLGRISSAQLSDEEDDSEAESWPSTVADAASRILGDLSASERASLASATDDDLSAEHFRMGMSIRNMFGLWGRNTQLLSDCARISRTAEEDGIEQSEINESPLFAFLMQADSASETILHAVRDLARRAH